MIFIKGNRMADKYFSKEFCDTNSLRSDYENSLREFIEKECKATKTEREQNMSPKKYYANPQEFRNKFIDMLGFPLTKPIALPKLISKQFMASDKNVNIYQMQFEVLGAIKFFGLYFEQVADKEKAPFVMAFHGKEGTPEVCSSIYMDSSNYNHMVRRATDRGANVFVPQNLIWSKKHYKEDYNRELLNAKLRQIGGSMTAMEVYISSSILSYFIHFENINEQRIGALGLSYGGMYTIYFSAFDQRVKSSFSCSWFSDTNGHTFDDWCYQNALKTFGNAQVAALVCPRTLAIAMGDKDQIFSSTGTIEEGNILKEFYKEFGKEENLLFYTFDGVHEFDTGDKGIDFMFNNL